MLNLFFRIGRRERTCTGVNPEISIHRGRSQFSSAALTHTLGICAQSSKALVIDENSWYRWL